MPVSGSIARPTVRLPVAVLLGLAVGTTHASGLQTPSEQLAEPVSVERLVWVMGTELRVRVNHADRARGAEAVEAAIREVERLDSLLGTWAPESPLSRLRDAPVGEPVSLPAELVAHLEEAEAWARRTDRVFDPVVGALVDAWDLRGTGQTPAEAELARALAASGAGVVRIDVGAALAVRERPAAWIDTGAFGKGAALRSAGRILRSMAVDHALLDLGGQLLALGDAEPGSGAGWTVAVADPADRARPVASLQVSGASVATSGASERWVEVGGERLGHILDPRTGRPVPAWGSVTVVAEDPFEADVLATALFVLGPAAALDWGRDREDVGVLVAENADPSPRMRWNPAMEGWLDR